MSTKHENLATALAAFQAELPHIAKGNVADVRRRDGSPSYKYSYADLTDVSAAVMPLLAKHGLAFTSAPTMIDGQFVLEYRLVHGASSNEEIYGMYPLPAGGSPQDIGGAITYARRYALCAVTGVAPGGDDDDAAGAQAAHTAAPKAATPPPAPQPPAPQPPAGWEERVKEATSVDEVKALYAAADKDGWVTEPVLEVLNARRLELERAANE